MVELGIQNLEATIQLIRFLSQINTAHVWTSFDVTTRESNLQFLKIKKPPIKMVCIIYQIIRSKSDVK